MKVRESGMPDETLWSSFFDPERILRAFSIDKNTKDVVEFGCGYGTFTLATALLISGIVFAIDIEPAMITTVREKCDREGISNVLAEELDFVAKGTGLPGDFADAAFLFNILHHEQPVSLMTEALRVLRPEGRLMVIHWNHNHATPRGPALEIRPRPDQCIEWGRVAGFVFSPDDLLDLKPYHYGLIFRKPQENRS